jgi:curved DNA-binding protein CbpA
MKKYFVNIETLEDLKKAYRKLAFELHPDRNGGNDVEFKVMVNQYDELFKKLQNKSTNAAEKEEDINLYKDIIDSLMRFEGIEIDVVGSWIWLSGNTFTFKDAIKALGFLWSSGKKRWFFNGEDKKKRTRSKKSYEDLKNE